VTTLAPRFVGAWERRSIAIDGGDHCEPARVVWLQGQNAFADLRVPRDPLGTVDAFAGITTYDAPALTWHHSLDWNGTFAEYDCGIVEQDGDELIERGEFDRDGSHHTYEEIWHRVDPGDAGVVLTATHAVVVRVGCVCLAMRDRRRAGASFDVRHSALRDGAWQDVVVLGDGAELPVLPVAVPNDWSAGEAVTLDGVSWRVSERWG